ncbi:hypothetical protein MA16_Dca002771 [Dendrobium catenatum]|uniref:Uncharacterized protein n=1 Tax=Dendrobium catenatum TaxID=906689 RepID=A0A2I0X8L0_9ASPA|nr:hypothetical protein MA16_Dca002771 [Dendrobium catenatum]
MVPGCSGRFIRSTEVGVYAGNCYSLAFGDGIFRTAGYIGFYPWLSFWVPGKLLWALRVLLGTMMSTVGPFSPWRVVLRQPGDLLEAFHLLGIQMYFVLFFYSHYL